MVVIHCHHQVARLHIRSICHTSFGYLVNVQLHAFRKLLVDQGDAHGTFGKDYLDDRVPTRKTSHAVFFNVVHLRSRRQ
jgi:hypothetical protein